MQRWETVEQVAEALARFERGNPEYRRPRAHGLVVDGEITVWNVGSRPLPAAVLAATAGHDGSTAALIVDPDTLDAAIASLAPAEACDAYDHPNLAAWRAARGHDVVAIYIGAE